MPIFNKEPKGFKKAKGKAEKYVDDKGRTNKLVNDALVKASRNRKSVSEFWNELQVLSRLIKSWTRGEYKNIPKRTIVLAIAALVYFVNPIDIIPDFLLAGGFLDDATVLAFVINSVVDDIKRFKEWEGQLE